MVWGGDFIINPLSLSLTTTTNAHSLRRKGEEREDQPPKDWGGTKETMMSGWNGRRTSISVPIFRHSLFDHVCFSRGKQPNPHCSESCQEGFTKWDEEEPRKRENVGGGGGGGEKHGSTIEEENHVLSKSLLLCSYSSLSLSSQNARRPMTHPNK